MNVMTKTSPEVLDLEQGISKKPHLSYSQMNMLRRCAYQYHLRYIRGIKLSPGIALMVGFSVDASVTRNLQNKIDNDELMPIEQIQDIARDIFEAKWSNEGVMLTDEEKENPGKAKGEAIDKTVRLSRLHGEDLAPSLNPVYVAKERDIILDGFPVNLKLITDIEEKNGIRDTKTSARTISQDIADASDQLTLYGMEWYARKGQLPEVLTLDCLIDTKIPKVNILRTQRKEKDFEVLLRIIETCVKSIESGIFIPARQGIDWWCSKKFCGYTDMCPYFRR